MDGGVESWYWEALRRLDGHCGEASIVLRHADREPIKDPFLHEEAMLTEHGRRCSQELGACLREKGAQVSSCMASPVRRCKETAELILQGHGADVDVKDVKLLGHIGPFIDDEEMAEMTFRLMHMQDICNGLLDGEEVPGFKDMVSGLSPLINALSRNRRPGLSLVVTHDFFIACIAGHALDMSFRGEEWIRFLEPLLLIRDGCDTRVWFRGREAPLEVPAP